MRTNRATLLLRLAVLLCVTLLTTSRAAAYEIDFVNSYWTEGPPPKIVLKLTGWTEGDIPYVCVVRDGEVVGLKINAGSQAGPDVTVEITPKAGKDFQAGDSVTVENAILGGEARFAKLGGGKGGGRADWPLVVCPEGECLPCDFPIPTVTEWGLIGLAVLLMTAGAVVLGRRQAAAV